jgi:hypothetical protein
MNFEVIEEVIEEVFILIRIRCHEKTKTRDAKG